MDKQDAPPSYENPNYNPVSTQPYGFQHGQPGQYGNPNPFGVQQTQPGPSQAYALQPVTNTTVVVQQQPAGRPPLRDWNSGLMGCFDDFGICLMGWCCAPCLACQLASDMGETICITCCVPNWLTVMRTKLRTQQGILGDVCNDCLSVGFCGVCVLCQMAREIKNCKVNGTLNN